MSRKYPGRDQHDIYSIMVWADIMVNRRTSLHVLQSGTVSVTLYIAILLSHVRIFRADVVTLCSGLITRPVT